jgi:maltooligosyltrehalose synthase
VVVPRLPVELVPAADRPPLGRRVWGATTAAVPPGRWANVLTGEVVNAPDGRADVAETLGVFPVALLLRESSC